MIHKKLLEELRNSPSIHAALNLLREGAAALRPHASDNGHLQWI